MDIRIDNTDENRKRVHEMDMCHFFFTKILQDSQLFEIGFVVFFLICNDFLCFRGFCYSPVCTVPYMMFTQKSYTVGMNTTQGIFKKKGGLETVHSDIFVKSPKSNCWDFDFSS